jgi:molybdopterin-guanine dinucleotide biosynthesis protein
MTQHLPRIVAVSGLSSNTGKTTLACELIKRLPGWEAIKLTRGHYRSCGKDPSGCCVSDLIRDEPLLRSGRDANYEFGKDTGRFWDAGAINVHWVIVGEDQVAAGIKQALSRVASPGVIVEGNSFLEYVEPDFAIMCARAGENKVKSSARRNLQKADALYLSTIGDLNREAAVQAFEAWRTGLAIDLKVEGPRIYTSHDLKQLIKAIRRRVGMNSTAIDSYNEQSKMAPDDSPGCKPGNRQPVRS